jgi:outer membrane protein, heavy metal efflux system
MKHILLILLTLSAAQAAMADVCSQPRSAEDVLSCVEKNHPEVRKIGNDNELIEGFQSAAGQFPNPNLTLETNKGKNLGDTVGEDSAVLSQLFEIGGKRSARRKAAAAQAEGVRASSLIVRAQLRMDTLSNLVRYRQLMSEIEVLSEAIRTYEKVISQFNSRPRLTPEQQVTHGIFRLALGDYRHRLANLEADRRKAEIFFKMVPELNFNEAKKVLPRRLAKWPKVELPPTDLKQVLAMKVAASELKQAEAESDLARAASLPDPTVSLVSIREVAGTSEFQRFGAAVSFPLPVFNWNGGQRQEAAARRTRAEIEYKRSQTAFTLERENLVSNYQGFVNALERSPVQKDIESKHQNTENLFYRGVISGVMVIEAHRQILDFTQSQNELELETVQVLQAIYFLDGKLSEFRYE